MGVFDKFSGIGVASGFKLQAKAPIDPRQVVDTIDDRDALITENGAYEGMQVYVKADKKTYLLKDLAAGTWEELGSGGGTSELLTIEISVSITETTADVLKTYLNNNADVLTELEAASSFILKVNKQNIATPDTYVFEQNYKNITTGAQHYFICVHAYGQTTTQSTILWFSVESGVVKDVTFKSNDLSSGGGTSVQSDYNQNDSAAADYIKNRPFYEETKTAFGEVFNETLAFEWNTVDNFGESNNNFNGSNPMGGIRGGESVTVIFNGVEYNLTTQDPPNEIKEEAEAIGGTGFVAGAPIPVEGVWAPTAEFPFSILYYGADDYKGAAISGLIGYTSINQASIPVIIKANKTTTELHTIDPKYIKDMYYETTTETEVYSGTLTTTASGSSYSGRIPLTTAWAGDGDTAKVIIDNVEYLLPVKSALGIALAAGDVDKDGIKIQTLIDTKTDIFTKTQYTGASFSLGVIKTDIHKIPDKYVPLAGKEIKVSASEGSTTSINNAIKEYLNNNVDDLNYLKTAMNFVLIVDINGSIIRYEFSRGAFSTISACSFVSLTADNVDAFDQYPYTNAFILNITLNNDGTVNNVVLKNVILLNSSTEWTLMVVDTDNDTEDNNGLMGIAHLDKDTGYYKFFNGSVSLHSWITKAQQRSDFQIPTPTKPTDLVDKQYADSLVSGGSSLSIELAVGASENTTDVFKTYLNNNASVLTQLKAASSFNLKVVKTTSVTTITETYVFAKNYTNTFTGVQYHFVCVYGSGQTSTAGSVLWFSLSNDTVSDLKLTTYTFASPTYNHNISITDGSSYSLRFTYPSKSSVIITTQAQLATLIGSEELTASGWALVDGVYYTIGFIKNNSYCYYGNAKAPTWNELGSYTITDSLL